MPDQYQIAGKIVSGARKAAFFTQLEWVQKQCADKLGFKPYPGTLNLEIERQYVPIIEKLQGENGISLIPPDPEFCTAKTLPVTIKEIGGAILIPAEDVNIHDNNIIEVIAPLSLKKALKVNDGDRLTLSVTTPEHG